MRKLIKYTFIIPVLLIYGCSWVEYFTENNKTDTPILDDHIIRKYPSITNTADTSTSIIYYLQNQKEIPLGFIRNNTVIDSSYYMDSFYSNSGERAYFEGDTVCKWNDNYSIGIVNYHGLVCSYKFILIINSENFVNTSYLIGATDCDRDGDREFYYFSYLIESDKIIVSENKVVEGQDIDDAIVVERLAYFIDESGNLITIQGK